MNDNDVDDLARVLAEHWENPSEFIHAFCHVMAAAVLASGVVVSARDVKALADDMRESEELYTVARLFEIAAAVGSCRAQTEALLREPATDAAPTGEGYLLTPGDVASTKRIVEHRDQPERDWTGVLADDEDATPTGETQGRTHKVEAYSMHPSDSSPWWGWQCLTCGKESDPDWKTPDEALERGEAHATRRPVTNAQEDA